MSYKKEKEWVEEVAGLLKDIEFLNFGKPKRIECKTSLTDTEWTLYFEGTDSVVFLEFWDFCTECALQIEIDEYKRYTCMGSDSPEDISELIKILLDEFQNGKMYWEKI